MFSNSPIVAVLPATDMERARAFYEGKLQLRLVWSDPGNMFFEAGQGTLLLVYKRDVPTKAEHTVAGFMVEDVEQAIEFLHNAGVTMEQYDLPGIKTDERGIATVDGEKAAWFTDSEGNIIAVSQMSPELGISARQRAHAAGV